CVLGGGGQLQLVKMAWPAERRGLFKKSCGAGLSTRLPMHGVAEVDEGIGDHAQPHPAPPSLCSLVAAPVKALSSLYHADAPLGSGPPSLAVAEPAFLLLVPAFTAFGGAIGDAHALNAHGFGRRLVPGRVEGCVGGQ